MTIDNGVQDTRLICVEISIVPDRKLYPLSGHALEVLQKRQLAQ